MAGVYEEFQEQLAAWAVRYQGRPRDEMLALFLLSLEREHVIAQVTQLTWLTRLAAFSVRILVVKMGDWISDGETLWDNAPSGRWVDYQREVSCHRFRRSPK